MKKYFWLSILLILPTFSILFQKGYFPIHDDLQTMRQMELHKCVLDGQFPCRWINDMGYGYGFPLFNFYPPLPYFLGEPLVDVGLSYIDTVKIVGIIGLIGMGVGMYLLAQEFLGPVGGLAGAVFYAYAPYHAVDFYVRAAVNEYYAGIFYPLVFWTSYKILQKPKWYWVLGLALSVAGLLLSHNQMMMIFAPVLMLWLGFWWFKNRTWPGFFAVAAGGFWGLGLAAFYTLPVIFEQKYAHVETLIIGYFNFLAHYLDIKQLFLNINWGYGSSVLGPGDTMSFAVGYAHWIVPVLVVALLAFNKKLRAYKGLVVVLLLSSLGALFMTHSKSTLIWQNIAPLAYLQFPWRFLTLGVFLVSFLASLFVVVSPRLVTAIVLTAVIVLNGAYFQPRTWYPNITDAERFSGHNWYLLTTNGIFDYLPKGAAQPPADPPGGNLTITQGEGTYNTVAKRTNTQDYRVEVTTPTAVAQIETYYFPGWRVWVDGRERAIDPKRDKLLGRIQVDLSSGQHEVVARFTNTPVRTLGNSLSVLTWVLALGIIIVCGIKPRLQRARS